MWSFKYFYEIKNFTTRLGGALKEGGIVPSMSGLIKSELFTSFATVHLC